MITMSAALKEFLLAGQADGLAPASMTWYRSILSRLVQTIGEDYPDTHVLREYMVALRERYKPHTVADHGRALHRFFSWSATEYEIANPMKGIKRPKMPPPVARAITSADFVALFNNAGEGDVGIRNRALLAFLADTGVRLGGVTGLTVDAVDLELRRAWVIEKGTKQRLVVFTFYTARLLERWLSIRPEKTRRVFTAMDTGDGLTNSGIQQILKRLKKKLNIQGNTNPHAFRHGFAKGYLANGGELATLARLMGHTDIQTTMDHYAVFSQDELSNLHEKYSPLKRILKHQP